MGGSYSSCVMNMSTEIIQIVLRENAEKFTTQVIDPGKHKVIPTGSGGVSLHVFKKGVNIWKEKAQCVYSTVSGTSFIVDYGPDGSLQIWRSVYGKIEKKDGDPASVSAKEEAATAQPNMPEGIIDTVSKLTSAKNFIVETIQTKVELDKTKKDLEESTKMLEKAEKERGEMTESLNKALTEIETLTHRLTSAECKIKERDREISGSSRNFWNLTEIIEVPEEAIAHIIGKKGGNIRDLCSEFRVKISFGKWLEKNKDGVYGEKVALTISGRADMVRRAAMRVSEISTAKRF